MTLVLIIVVLLVTLGQTVMIWKMLHKIDLSADRIIQSLDGLYELIKIVISDRP